MPLKEFRVLSSEDEKVRRILNRFYHVTIIGIEDEEEMDLYTRPEVIEERKARYRKLAGKAKEVGEDMKELNKISEREEPWREEEGE